MSFPIEHNEGRIYGNDRDGFVFSYRDQWVDGIYDSLETARAAILFVEKGREEWLTNLWRSLKADRMVTMQLLRHQNQIELGL